jgi:hypothetical protein
MDDMKTKNGGTNLPSSPEGAVLVPEPAVSRKLGSCGVGQIEEDGNEKKRRRIGAEERNRQHTRRHLIALEQQEREHDEEAVDSTKDMKTLILKDLRSDHNEATVVKALTSLYNNHFKKGVDEKQRITDQNDFYDLGGHVLVLGAMEKRPESRYIQSWGVRLLKGVSLHYPRLKKAIGKTDMASR